MLVVTLSYFGAGIIGLEYAVPPGNATVVWPSSGIALAALLLLGYRSWPAVLLGSFLVNLTTRVPVHVAFSFSLGNTAEALIGAWLLRVFIGDFPFRKAKHAFQFLGICASSCVPAASIGVGSLFLSGEISRDLIPVNWWTWWLGDLTGQLVIVPPLVAIRDRRLKRLSLGRTTELLLVFLVQVVLSFLIFGNLLPEHISGNLLYFPMVVLIWISLRFRLLETSLSTLFFAAAAVLGTLTGARAHGSQIASERLFLLQILVTTYSVTALAITGVIHGRRRAEVSSVKSHSAMRRQMSRRARVERWFSQLLASSPDALIVSSRGGKILLVNKAAERLFGFERQELLGESIEVLIPGRFRRAHRVYRSNYVQSPFVRLMGKGLELTGCRKDGSEFPAEIALGPMRTEAGTVVFSAIRDITARKKAAQALRESEERFALAVRGTDAGIWDWDLRTNRVYFSARWKSMIGYEEREIENDFSEWESRLHPDDREFALQSVKGYLEGRMQEYELEHRLQHKDGSYRWILARGAVVRDDDGKPYRMAGSHLDITERKEMEERLVAHQAQLMAAAEIQSYLHPNHPPSVPGLDIAGRCYPSDFAAGDHFDFLLPHSGMFVPIVADVSGHGVGPAILMAYLGSCIRAFIEVRSDLCDVISEANAILEESSPDDRFVTLLAAIIDVEALTLAYVRCGHPPGFIMNANGDVAASLDDGDLALGLVQDYRCHQSETFGLSRGDIVVLLTDGLIELMSPGRELFGIERTIRVVRENRGRPAQAIIEALRQATCEFGETTRLEDDMTIVIVKVL